MIPYTWDGTFMESSDTWVGITGNIRNPYKRRRFWIHVMKKNPYWVHSAPKAVDRSLFDQCRLTDEWNGRKDGRLDVGLAQVTRLTRLTQISAYFSVNEMLQLGKSSFFFQAGPSWLEGRTAADLLLWKGTRGVWTLKLRLIASSLISMRQRIRKLALFIIFPFKLGYNAFFTISMLILIKRYLKVI